MPSHTLHRAAQVILVLCVPIVLLAVPLYALWQPAYLRYQYSRSAFPASRFSDAERLRLSETILRYTAGQIPLEQMAEMRTDDGTPALLPSEVEHLVDVRVVLQRFYLAGGIALALALLTGLLLAHWSPDRLAKALYGGIGITCAFILGAGAMALMDFDRFFTLFHGLFFRPGSWTFFYEDTLIQLYPLPFWITAVLHLLAGMGLLTIILLAVARRAGRRSARSVQP